MMINRAMFIIDDKGILRQITINDRPVGRNVSEARRLIRIIQHAEKLRESASTGSFIEGKKMLNYTYIFLYVNIFDSYFCIKCSKVSSPSISRKEFSS
jgi:hypothetical protein